MLISVLPLFCLSFLISLCSLLSSSLLLFFPSLFSTFIPHPCIFSFLFINLFEYSTRPQLCFARTWGTDLVAFWLLTVIACESLSVRHLSCASYWSIQECVRSHAVGHVCTYSLPKTTQIFQTKVPTSVPPTLAPTTLKSAPDWLANPETTLITIFGLECFHLQSEHYNGEHHCRFT